MHADANLNHQPWGRQFSPQLVCPTGCDRNRKGSAHPDLCLLCFKFSLVSTDLKQSGVIQVAPSLCRAVPQAQAVDWKTPCARTC